MCGAEKPAAQKGPFPYALSRMFRNAKHPKDPSFSVHITREGGWAKCFHCDFAIAWNEDEMWKREQKQQDRERQKQQKDASQQRNTAQHHDTVSQHHNTAQHHDAAPQQRNTSQPPRYSIAAP